MDNTHSIRRLVTLEKVADVQPIPNADAIERARVRGWDVVVRKGEVQIGDTVLYFEIDAALPLDDQRFAFLEPRGSKVLEDGTKVHVLKTARLRGQYSQGLVVPLDVPTREQVVKYLLNEEGYRFDPSRAAQDAEELVGIDVSEVLGVTKYEPPIPANLAGDVVGPFPTDLVQKTDSERVQNLSEVFDELHADGDWVATEKIDGTSTTYIVTGDEDNPIRVCSRNWELQPNPDLTSMQLAEQHRLTDLPAGTIIQGEVYGEGIQGNPLKIKGCALAVFSVFTAPRTLVPRAAWPESLKEIAAPELDLQLPATVDAAVEQVEGMKSLVSPGHQAEGIVWHERSGRSFQSLENRANLKAINNKYLLKHG